MRQRGEESAVSPGVYWKQERKKDTSARWYGNGNSWLCVCLDCEAVSGHSLSLKHSLEPRRAAARPVEMLSLIRVAVISTPVTTALTDPVEIEGESRASYVLVEHGCCSDPGFKSIWQSLCCVSIPLSLSLCVLVSLQLSFQNKCKAQGEKKQTTTKKHRLLSWWQWEI